MEERLGPQHFIHYGPLPIAPTNFRHVCGKCGPTLEDGYWMVDGTGICDPCVKRGVAENMASQDEEIQYHD